MAIWRVNLSAKLWNQNEFVRLYNLQNEADRTKYRLAQSKGNRHMVNMPHQGDLVKFVLKGKIVMKGVFDCQEFIIGIEHQSSSCNIGKIEDRIHSLNQEYAWVRITEVGLNQTVPFTGQATWLDVTNREEFQN